MLIKLGLGGMGALFTCLGLFMLITGMGGGGNNEHLTFAMLSIVIGLSGFVAMDILGSRKPRRPKRSPPSIPPVTTTHPPPMPESARPATAPPPAPAPASNMGTPDTARNDNMTHLERADYWAAKIPQLPSEKAVRPLLQSAVTELKGMGYSGKGLEGFLGRMGSNLAATSPSTGSQASINRKEALTAIQELVQSPP